MYGRQSLATRYIPFRPASLYLSDRKNGDANAICFGPQELDSKVWKEESVEIILDMEKFRARRMERQNSCIFFKQQDLGFTPRIARKVEISQDASIKFNHTIDWPHNLPRHTAFSLYKSNFQISFAKVPYQHLISSNFEAMTAIQTLNFFRYLDSLKNEEEKDDLDIFEGIYGEIADLNEQQLKDFLVRLHKEVTDTAEFNFYGAYSIDPELIESIRYAPNGHSPLGSVLLRPSQLIDRLNEGDLTYYQEIKEKMPFLFESKRFLNFLMSKVNNPEVLKVLREDT